MLYTFLGAVICGIGLRVLSSDDRPKPFLLGLSQRNVNTAGGIFIGLIIGMCYDGYKMTHGHYLPWR